VRPWIVDSRVARSSVIRSGARASTDSQAQDVGADGSHRTLVFVGDALGQAVDGLDVDEIGVDVQGRAGLDDPVVPGGLGGDQVSHDGLQWCVGNVVLRRNGPHAEPLFPL